MRILFLTPQVPYPPHKGTTIRNFHLIKHLAPRHEITLLSFRDPAAEFDIAPLRQHCVAVDLVDCPSRSTLSRLLDLPFPARPDLVRRLRSAAFVARLGKLLEQREFDLVQVEGLEMALHWMAACGQAHGRPIPAILDEHNAEYVLQRRAFEIDRRRPPRWRGAVYSLLQWRKLVHFERDFCRQVDGVVAASELDREALLALDKRLRIAVVPNGVDAEHYKCDSSTRSDDGTTLVFVGTMDFRPNVDGVLWFCESVWPRIAAELPRARFVIAGRDPKPEVRRLADGDRVVVTGAVDDVRPLLAAAAVTVVPLRIGGGSRLKVLEAMAAGVPVVSTTIGCEGIAVTPATAVIADEPAALSRATIELLRDSHRRAALAAAGRALATRQYDWRVIVPRLEAFHHEVLAR